MGEREDDGCACDTTAHSRVPPSEAVEPVHFHVPRSEQLKTFFQDDLFPPAPTGMPGTTAGDWFGGYDAPQPRATLCPEGMTPLSEKPAEKQEVRLPTAAAPVPYADRPSLSLSLSPSARARR